MRPFHNRPTAFGFALLEVIVASAIATTIAAGSFAVISMSIQANDRARIRTGSTMLAVRKMEQLRSLGWTHISTSAPPISMSLSDVTTNLGNDPPTDDGRGLLASPPGTLTSNIDGYVDYLDASSRSMGSGTAVPAAAVYIRRWAVQPHPVDPDNLLVFHVFVGTRGTNGTAVAGAIHLITLGARK